MTRTNERFQDIWAKLGEQERRVLLLLAARLLAGQEAYGALDLGNDARDLLKEAAEEDADGAIYRAMGLVKEHVVREMAKEPKTPERPGAKELSDPPMGDVMWTAWIDGFRDRPNSCHTVKARSMIEARRKGAVLLGVDETEVRATLAT